MANFKLFLLNLRNTSNGVPTFISQPISIFSNEQEETEERGENTKGFVLNQNPSFCYSYDEKFQIHQNSQKTLSFSMDRRITREDRIEDNPFIYYLYAGAQLLLIDRYDNHHLMTIKKISFTFKEFNTVYNFECQDSFSYQLSRQNNGYEITNDASTTDFIGAKQIDWWVLCKIHPECNISYSYVKLGDNLILNKKKIKHKLTESDYFTSVPFSGSGTANSVLISLGDLVGLQLKVYERFNFDTGELQKYYWFEPKKNLRSSGLKYSPHSNVQSFSMTHEGQSLSSVFNIQTHQIGDEMISLIPSVPTFFKQWFTSQSWTDTKFVNGLFRSKCEEQVYRFDNEEMKWDKDDKCYYINTDFKLDPLYDHIRLNNSAGEYSEIEFSTTYKSSLHSTWKIRLEDETKNKLEQEDNMTIPQDWFGKTINRIGIILNDNGLGDGVGTIIISLCRDYSTEDVEFATIADQCPWLENRLIDFKYFLDHSIISKKQYGELMNIIQNDLRLANAKLLIYSEDYYRAWQHKTEVISKITKKIDVLGAIFNSDFVDAFNQNVKKVNTQDFTMAISDLFNSNNKPVLMINYYETLSDYINKYINAEYTFLKNMYQFRKYFDCKVDYDNYYTYTLTAPNGETENIKYCFTNQINNWKNINSSNISNINGRSLYELVDGSYVPVNMNDIVTIDNYSNFYQEKAFNNTLVKSSGAYKKDVTYYKQNGSIYEKVDLLDMKINYIGTKAKDSDWVSQYYYKTDSFSTLKTDWSNLNLKKEVLLKHPALANINESDFNDIQNDEGVRNSYYKKYIPLTSLIFTEGQKDPITVPFVNGENYSNFYRRISTQNRWLWGFVSPDPLVRTVRCIAELVYRYGGAGFGTEGWTYQDIFGEDLGISFNGYKDLGELLYTASENSFDSINVTKNNWTSSQWKNEDASNIALTWSSWSSVSSNASQGSYKYEYKTRWWRILRSGDKIEKDENYVILYDVFLTNPENSLHKQKTLDENSTSYRLNSTIYYPLENVLVPLTTEYVSWGTDNTITLSNWVKQEFNVNSGVNINDDGFVSISNPNYKFYVLHQEDYDYKKVSSSLSDKTLKSLALQTWFDTKTFKKISLQNQSDFTASFYVVAGGDNSYEKVEDVTEENLEKIRWFKKVAPNKYERVYTLKQLVGNKSIYIDSALTYTLNTFDDLNEIVMPLYKYTKVNDQWVLDGQVEKTFSNFDDNSKEESPISNMTNGTFWYKHKNDLKNTVLMEHAMLIETTLTEYWTNAYYASKNCRFFLPEFWQPSVDQTTNHFSSSVLLIGEEKVQLSNQLVPLVKPVAGQTQYQFKNSWFKTTDEEQKAIDFKLPLNTVFSASQVVNTNPFLYNIFNYLRLNASEWTGTSVKNDYTYYEYEGGGMLWSDALVKLSYGALSYPDQFGGWYDMMIWTLQKGNYQNYIPQQYQNALDEHNRIWRKLYTNYPNLILEQSYTNEDTTTSAELFKVSSIAFKDYTNIETQYNITTIDSYNIKNYLGQELRIGDGIELVANELYPDYNSDVYKSLQQYLYITDINYNLRSDKDIQLTVNTIKYADKVIGELVKLIR